MIKIAPLLRELYTVADGGETEEKKFDFQNKKCIDYNSNIMIQQR